MKHLIFVSGLLIFFTSCTAPGSRKAITDTTAEDFGPFHATGNHIKSGSYSFLNVSGKNNADTTKANLQISNGQVTGKLIWLPYQKDRRMGKLSGILKGDTITAVWAFMQEGMTDTLNLKFKLSGGELLQKPLKLNTKTGRDQTDELAGYSIKFRPATNK